MKMKECTPATRRQCNDVSLPLLGFGMMRLPGKEGAIDKKTAREMIDRAMAAGCNYFDTAYMYHNGESEKLVGEVLSGYPRESWLLTSKMPVYMLTGEADAERIFEEQLQRTRAGYFDFYLMHWLNDAHWKMAKRFNVYAFLEKMKRRGKIRRIGFSFHDEPELLEEIAKAHPWDLVQIQLNYLDWELCRSREQYELLTQLGIPVAVMEPLKGGTLVKLTPEARASFTRANPSAPVASWGLRYAASLPNVATVLSGMSAPGQLEENLGIFAPFVPLTDEERRIIAEALAVYRKTGAIPCTACRYCSPCPVGVDIPRNLGILNQRKAGEPLLNGGLVYNAMAEKERASACIACGVCKTKCPQKIDIPKYLAELAAEFR